MVALFRFFIPFLFPFLALSVFQSTFTGVTLRAETVMPASPFEDTDTSGTIIPPPFAGDTGGWVDSVFSTLTPEQRIGQLIMVDAYSDSSDSLHARDEEILRLIGDYNIGGLIFMGGGPVRQAAMTNRYQSAAKTPLMIGMDAEWGLGMRLDSTVSYPRHLIMGAVQDNKLIYDMAADVARQMRRLGVHINMAPVLDINVNPRNPVIGSRSFGGDKWNVAEKATQYMQGMQDNGVLAVGKHFPGHGDTDQDSHYTLPVITHNRERFDSLELVPFRHLIDSGMGGVMTAHLHIPAIDNTDGLASSLSENVVEGLLREELGFRGLVFTDGLNMKGVSDYFPPGRLAVQALLAGNDVLLIPSDVDKTVAAIKEALEQGVLKQEMIDEKCRRVLKAKYWLGLHRETAIDTGGLHGDLNTPESELLKRRITAASLTLLKNHNDLVPLKRLDTLNIATVSVGRGEKTFFQETLELYAPMEHFTVSKYSTLERFDQLMKDLDRFNLVIVGIHEADGRRSRQYGISPQTSYFIRNLAVRNNLLLTVFTSPYGLAFFDDLSNISALLMSYDDNINAQDYSAQLIFGGTGAEGRLPVNVTREYGIGDGFETRGGIRLGYSIPEDAGLDSGKLQEIDGLVDKAIRERATPGAQVLVARRGKVVYHKAFGYHTYRGVNPVKTGDLYDIASITKIAASVPAIMKLIEEDKLDLGRNLGYYLPELRGTNKNDLIIKDVLTHQAGLQPWIPFYYDTFESLVPGQELFSRRVSARYPYMLGGNMYMNRNHRFVDSLFSEAAEGDFTVRVADRMFMNKSYLDSIYKRIDQSPLRAGNRYLYSDLGYYYLKNIIERISSEPLDSYTEKNIYRPLGAARMTYMPREKFYPGEIAPTENDIVFRRQVVHGYVHDHGTAMMGGVAGHAGIFSNANDLAKLMQLYLQGGDYGGMNFFSPETIRRFTSAPNSNRGNRRGIGFDKPPERYSRNAPAARSASQESFGHSGFTGTIAWADPVEDIVYIFLSNRVHPDQFNNKLLQMNLRTEIQQVIYDSIVQ